VGPIHAEVPRRNGYLGEQGNLDLLAALSHQTDFSVGCYCAEESHCHRSVLRALLMERGAQVT
jgi:uncharacterized protein YeaO (DUF488 family)